MGVWEEDGLVPARGHTVACVRLEDRVTWRLSIRKHFPAPAGLCCSWDRPGATSAGTDHGWDFPDPALLP